jgi:hypothetical protein
MNKMISDVVDLQALSADRRERRSTAVAEAFTRVCRAIFVLEQGAKREGKEFIQSATGVTDRSRHYLE